MSNFYLLLYHMMQKETIIKKIKNLKSLILIILIIINDVKKS